MEKAIIGKKVGMKQIFEEAGNVTRALLGEEIGTLVSTAESTLA